MPDLLQLCHFCDNASIKGREDRYETVLVRTAPVLKSWKSSLFSFEWLTPEGDVRQPEDLPLIEREKRLAIEKAISKGQALERPVLGIGLLDNVEIGAGRPVFLTLAAHGHEAIEVHIPKSARQDFKFFLTAAI